MPSLLFSNKLISLNKGMHIDFACLIFSLLNNCPSKKAVKAIITKAITIK